MNLEAINKWLDEEYGCSYTRLEELHDFYFEKYCDLQQENKQLKDNWNKLREYFNERIEVCDNRLSSPFCNFEKATKERLIFSQCLEKLEELEQGSDKWPCVEEIDIQQQGIDALNEFIKLLKEQGSASDEQGSDSNENNDLWITRIS